MFLHRFCRVMMDGKHLGSLRQRKGVMVRRQRLESRLFVSITEDGRFFYAATTFFFFSFLMTTNTQNNVAFGIFERRLVVNCIHAGDIHDDMTCDMTPFGFETFLFLCFACSDQALIFGVCLFIRTMTWDLVWDLFGRARHGKARKGLNVNLILGETGYKGLLSLYAWIRSVWKGLVREGIRGVWFNSDTLIIMNDTFTLDDVLSLLWVPLVGNI